MTYSEQAKALAAILGELDCDQKLLVEWQRDPGARCLDWDLTYAALPSPVASAMSGWVTGKAAIPTPGSPKAKYFVPDVCRLILMVATDRATASWLAKHNLSGLPTLVRGVEGHQGAPWLVSWVKAVAAGKPAPTTIPDEVMAGLPPGFGPNIDQFLDLLDDLGQLWTPLLSGLFEVRGPKALPKFQRRDSGNGTTRASRLARLLAQFSDAARKHVSDVFYVPRELDAMASAICKESDPGNVLISIRTLFKGMRRDPNVAKESCDLCCGLMAYLSPDLVPGQAGQSRIVLAAGSLSGAAAVARFDGRPLATESRDGRFVGAGSFPLTAPSGFSGVANDGLAAICARYGWNPDEAVEELEEWHALYLKSQEVWLRTSDPNYDFEPPPSFDVDDPGANLAVDVAALDGLPGVRVALLQGNLGPKPMITIEKRLKALLRDFDAAGCDCTKKKSP